MSWPQFIVILAVSASAAYAGGRFLPASAYSRLRKRVSEMSSDIETLVSESERQRTLVRSISNRLAVREHRAKLEPAPGPTGDAPPVGTPKHELRKFYGLTGSPREVAAKLAGVKNGED